MYLKEVKSLSLGDLCTPRATAALFTRAKLWKEPVCHQQIMDKDNIDTHPYPQGGFEKALKKEILPFITTWMNLEDIMLSEISQIQTDRYYMAHSSVKSEESSSQKNEVEWWLPEAGAWGAADQRVEVSVTQDD